MELTPSSTSQSGAATLLLHSSLGHDDHSTYVIQSPYIRSNVIHVAATAYHVQRRPTMTQHYEVPKEPSPQVKAILHYFDQIKVLNLQEIEKHFADDFVQSTRPSSLGIPFRSKEEDLAFLGGLADQLGGRPLEVTIFDIIESSGKVWAHLLMHGEPQEGKPFDIECIYQFIFAENYKFKALIDFVDSKALAAMG
ncbi:hypothetical protein BJY52DRAFT_307499 [Lactarius psammicola]|nr:hypothetical protein BJY52DRAFT_307499 [Lactarius psammicola]